MSAFHAWLFAVAMLAPAAQPADDQNSSGASSDASDAAGLARALEEFRRDAETYRMTLETDRDMLATVFGNGPFQRAKIYYSVYKP